MKTESRRVCSICGNEFSGAMEFCPVCMLRKALAGGVESGESSVSEAVPFVQGFPVGAPRVDIPFWLNAVYMGKPERVRPQATGSATARDLTLTITGATYTVTGPLSQSPERRAVELWM